MYVYILPIDKERTTDQMYIEIYELYLDLYTLLF